MWLVACGGAAAPPREVAQAQFPAAYAAAFCALTTKCCSTDELASFDPSITDRASCEAWSLRFADQSARIAQGTVSYDPQQGAACIDALAALDCRIAIGFIPACERYYQGRKAIGQSCDLDWECAGGFCGAFPGQAAQCHPQSREGEPCGNNHDCLPGWGCSDRRWVCVARSRAIGESCDDSSQCVTELCDRGACRAQPFCDGT
jgi:hypothetical protein